MIKRMLDACLMEAAQLKINPFEEFWKYLVDREHADKMGVTDKVKSIVDCSGTSTPITLGSQILDKQKRIRDQTALTASLELCRRLLCSRIPRCLTYDDNRKGWRGTDEWENPVCGWTVVNFPDYSIQVFDQDGHFIHKFQI